MLLCLLSIITDYSIKYYIFIFAVGSRWQWWQRGKLATINSALWTVLVFTLSHLTKDGKNVNNNSPYAICYSAMLATAFLHLTLLLSLSINTSLCTNDYYRYAMI